MKICFLLKRLWVDALFSRSLGALATRITTDGGPVNFVLHRCTDARAAKVPAKVVIPG